MKARKRPVVVEVYEYLGDGLDALNWSAEFSETGTPLFISLGGKKEPGLYIQTLEGDMHVSVGDFIIRGVNGEFYPCKPDIFEKTYEKVE